MRATFALLASRDVENAVNRLAWEIHLCWKTGVQVRRLPAHVSLKQPFEIGDKLDVLEQVMAEWAAQLAPFQVTLTELVPWTAGLAYPVQETAHLRALHDRLNRELPTYFADPSALHDGAGYRFHLTVLLGGASPGTYRSIQQAYRDRPFISEFTTRDLAMFVYDQHPLDSGSWEYLTYLVLPLQGERAET
jgi:2'-5' RNA ligase